MDLEKRLQAFVNLGTVLRYTFGDEENEVFSKETNAKIEALKAEVASAKNYNGWFEEGMVGHALLALGESLQEEKLKKWVSAYPLDEVNIPKTVGVVMAGNVPAVGFHDFLSVLMSGHRILARLSSDDSKLLPAVADILLSLEPGFESYITFTDNHLKGFDAVIATGSNNTSRYFEYYFGKYPNIIRKNRNGVAVLDGKETEGELEALANDIFLYFGLGCRNVSKIFVPKGYDFKPMLAVIGKRTEIAQHHKYFNNYEYNKAIYLINKRSHLDTGNLLLVEDEQIASPVGVLYYEYYDSEEILRNSLMVRNEEIQCILSQLGFLPKAIPLGYGQQPELWDYADGVDTMEFLIQL
jgi:hypothetical protein